MLVLRKTNSDAALCVARVTRPCAMDYCNGKIQAPELWSYAVETGEILFVNGIRGPLMWRKLAQELKAEGIKGIVFRSRVPSIVDRAQRFGATLMRTDFEADGKTPKWTYFAEGAAFRAFRDALCRQRGEQSLACS